MQGCTTSRLEVASGIPRAEVNDRMQADDDGSKPRFFVVVAIDGSRVPNAAYNSRRIDMGASTNVMPYLVARPVPAKRARYALLGTHIVQVPFHEFLRRLSGTFQRIEGEVDFEPQPGMVYRVNGELFPQSSSVWIEEFDTGKVVSERVVSKK